MKILLLGDPDTSGMALLRRMLPEGVQLETASHEEAERDHALLADAEVIVAGSVSQTVLEKATNLQTLVIPFAGVPRSVQVNLEGFPRVRVVNCRFNAAEAAEHAWALLLAAAKRLIPADAALRNGDWGPRYEAPASVLLEGKCLLLIGYGAIGTRVARYARAFGMKVDAVKRTAGTDPGIDRLARVEDLDLLLPEADAIVVSLPDTPETRGLISGDRFDRMKQGVVFVNVGRGAVVEEEAFFEAMRSGRIGAAGLDPWWVYPGDPASTPPSRFPMHEFVNLVMSPHRASHVREREERRYTALAGILREITAGRQIRAVDRSTWY